MNTHHATIHPGQVRGLQQVASPDGYFLVCALDHITEFTDLLDAGSSFGDIVCAKLDLVRAVAPASSAVLVDAHYGAGYLAASGALPADVGLMLSLEDGDYSDSAPKRTRYRNGWNPQKAQAAGADAVKLLWWYRPDGDPELADSQRREVRQLARTCRQIGLPLVVEPIWFRRPGETPTSWQWRARRAEGIVESAVTAQELGADLLKVEFPTDLTSDIEARTAADVLAELGSSVRVPWVILSAGAPFPVFERQVRIACQAGASGYIAGRSLWREAVAAPAADRPRALGSAVDRLARLNALTRTYGQPYRPAIQVPELLKALPEGWYAGALPGDQ